MYPDGICKVNDRLYSKTMQFEDINYQLAQPDDKTAIFEGLCDFYNSVDSSVGLQLTFLNKTVNREEYESSISIPLQQDGFDDVRAEYSAMLKKQLSKGNNGLSKTKYLTFALESDSLKNARSRLGRLEADILSQFKVLGVQNRPLEGKERLEVLHGIFHPDGEKFRFDYRWLAPSGLSTKDFIAPSSFQFKEGRTFRMGKKIGAVSFLQIIAPELNDRLLADFLDMDSALMVSLHIRSIDQTEAIKTIKRKITDLDRMKIEEQKKAVRSGYDMDIIPSDLATYGGEAKDLLRDLQSRNERMFLMTFTLVNFADSKQQLDNQLFQAASVAQKANCILTRLDYQQEVGLMSALPLGWNQVPIQRSLTTSSTAIFVPFTTQELFQNSKAAKNTILICDPEAEYAPLVNRLGGQVVKISATSKDYVNPLDINMNYSEDENPLSLKSDFIISMCELIIDRKEGLEAIEKTVIDRAVKNVYRAYLADPIHTEMPILEDLYNELKAQPEIEAQRVAAALELYVHGSLNVFNHRTNIDIHSRIVAYDIKELGKQLKKLGMLIIQDQVWGRVTENRDKHESTWFYCDEFHLLLKEEQTAAYSVEIWKRFRKWGGIPTGITQNVKDLLRSREIENIFENSDFVYMLNQAGGDREILAKQLGISNQQLKYVTHSEAGTGLLFYGSVILPFVDRFPQDLELYRIMSTKPEDLAGKEAKED